MIFSDQFPSPHFLPDPPYLPSHLTPHLLSLSLFRKQIGKKKEIKKINKNKKKQGERKKNEKHKTHTHLRGETL